MLNNFTSFKIPSMRGFLVYNISMKILQLNVWMGKVEGELKRFLENNKFDVICMQEVMSSENCQVHLARLCFDAEAIKQATGMPYAYFSPNWSSDLANGSFDLGNMILSRIPFRSTMNTFVNGEYTEHTILEKMCSNNLNVQVVELENGVVIANHHGFWRSQPLGDEDTVKAFKHLAEIIQPYQDKPFVLCGDLNVRHEAPAMRELDFLRDLTYENGVKNTLSGLKFNGDVPCDHIMPNDKLEAKNFMVHDGYASDHLGISAEIEIK